MLQIIIKTPQEKKEDVGKFLCSSLVGEEAYIDNDIIVNYTDYDDIYIVLGKDTENMRELEIDYKDITFQFSED